jgi:hypothetical protein
MFLFLTTYPILFLFGFFSVGLALLFYISFLKLKRKELSRIAVISSELEQEKKIAQHLKSAPKKVAQIEHNTHQKLLKIRVCMINIHHAFSEIFTP